VIAPRTRVLVCEDSTTFAMALTRTLEHGGDIEVVGVCPTAEAAISGLARLQPDLITMDVHLPGMSGLDAVEQIMSVRPTPILVLSSQVTGDGEIAAAALAAGALEAMAKDELPLREPGGDAATVFRQRVKLLSRARVIRHPRGRLTAGTRNATLTSTRRGGIVAVCASTGGPQAIAAVLAAIPSGYPLPILVVQHIAAGFTEGLARWLDGAIPLPVRLAEHGLPALPGVTVAPEGAHLVFRSDGTLALDHRSPAGLHRPSADMLLTSVASAARSDGIGVVLTGMGRDGAVGLQAIGEAGGLTIAQDEASSSVYGMPREAAKLGAELILPLGEIAGVLTTVALERRVGAR
jgi:two-component system, chemotaxis family, protein-glutamate methylesterase/glutaminase